MDAAWDVLSGTEGASRVDGVMDTDDEAEAEVDIDQLREQAHQAIQNLVTATFGPMVVRQWLTYAETVDDEDDRPMMFLVESANMPPWCLSGMAHFGMHLVEDITEGM